MWKQWHILFSWAPKSLWMFSVAMKLRLLLLGRKTMTKPNSILKSKDITLPTKVRIVKMMAFPVCLVTQFCPTLCNSMDCSMPGFSVHHQFPELRQIHVRGVGDAFQTISSSVRL